MKIEISWTFKLRSSARDEQVRLHAQRVMEELLKLEPQTGLSDSAVSIDLGSRDVIIEAVMEAEEYEAAISEALGCIRTAMHAAGGATLDWPAKARLEPGAFQAEPV